MSKPSLIDRAIDLHRAGQLDKAADLYGQILRSQPNHLDALHLLGLIAYQRGDDARAVELIRRAIAINSNQVMPHNHLGMALLRQEKWDEAATCFERALKLNPGFASAHNNLGTVRQCQNRLEEAAACYRQTLVIDPGYSKAHYNLGRVLRLSGDLYGAADCFRKASALDPAYADALASLAEVLLAQGQAAEAIPHYQKALALAPNKATWHCGLGDALQTLKEFARAAEAYQQAVALDPAYLQPWWGLGCAQSSLGEYAAAADSLRRAVEIAPDYGEAHYNLGKALFELGQVDPALDAFHRAATLLEAPVLPLGSIATIIPGSPRADNQAVLDARRAWAALALPSPPSVKPISRPPSRSDQHLRLGYVCAFFQDRNWMKPVWGLINHHDRDRFEIHLFSDAPESSIRHGYCKHPRDHYHDISRLSNEETARLIEEQGIDILVDMNAYSQLSRLPLFALKPAPVQVSWFILFATSGMSCFDSLIGDEHVIPAAEEAFYSERIIRIPGCYMTFEVTYPVPDVAPAPCLSRGYITFGCLAPQYKITTEVVEAWSRILHACPDSRLILKNRLLKSPQNGRFVHDLFTRFGVPCERVELEGPAEHYTFLGKYADIDIALDTFPYNGGTTTTEALWQGVPVLSFTGDRWVARISASLMRNANLPEFVAPDLDGCVGLAAELASDPDTPAKLDELRRTMRDRLRRAPVCDCRTFARDMEREYRRLWDRQSVEASAHPEGHHRGP